MQHQVVVILTLIEACFEHHSQDCNFLAEAIGSLVVLHGRDFLFVSFDVVEATSLLASGHECAVTAVARAEFGVGHLFELTLTPSGYGLAAFLFGLCPHYVI